MAACPGGLPGLHICISTVKEPARGHLRLVQCGASVSSARGRCRSPQGPPPAARPVCLYTHPVGQQGSWRNSSVGVVSCACQGAPLEDGLCSSRQPRRPAASAGSSRQRNARYSSTGHGSARTRCSHSGAFRCIPMHACCAPGPHVCPHEVHRMTPTEYKARATVPATWRDGRKESHVQKCR